MLVPSSILLQFEVAVDGSISALIEMNFSEVVILSGVPRWLLSDGFGNTHKATSASPHVHSPGILRAFVHARFAAIPAFGDYVLIVPGGDPHVQNVGGDRIVAGTYSITDDR